MELNLHVRSIEDRDAEVISTAFSQIGWDKPASQYHRYLGEQGRGEREVFVAFADEEFSGYVTSGYVTVLWRPEYPPFRSANIPEIQDLNVLPEFRRLRIATRLMGEAERVIAERSPVVGLGVGMMADYGAAQRMYVERGYVPDGRGLMYRCEPVVYGERTLVDDDLVLYFTKDLT